MANDRRRAVRPGSRRAARSDQTTTQGSFEILAHDEIGDASQSPDKKVRVVTPISYRLR